MGNQNKKTKVFTKEEVNKAIPKARQLSAKRQGKPYKYTEQDVVNALYDYINGYNIDPKDKTEMLSPDNLNWALEYLNNFGHNQDNLNYVVNGLYEAPRNKRNKQHFTKKAKENKEHNYTYGYNNLGKNLLNFTFGTLDVPRKAIASFVQSASLNRDPRYYPTKVLDVMDKTPTPIMGVEFAQENPITSAAVDIMAPFAVANLYGKAVNVGENVFNYATRKPLTGFTKSNVLQQIRTNNIPTNQNYEVVRTLIPKQGKTVGGTTFNTYTKAGGSKLTGTVNPATGKPYVIGSTVNGSSIGSQFVKVPTVKAVDNVYGWTTIPYTPINWFGLPQFVQKPKEQVIIPFVPENTIVEELPYTYDDSDIINALGADSGDVIHMPDGRIVKYIPGDGGRGRNFNYNVVNEYDHHITDVKQQPNVPQKLRVTTRVNKGPVVKVIPGRNPEYMERDYNNYFPYIISTNE